MIKKVLCCGSRNWSRYDVVARELRKYDPEKTLVIHGGCNGADLIADHVARGLRIHVAEVDALWDLLGKSAGPKRNAWMLMLQPTEAIAFHEDIEKSKGTKDMVGRLEAVGIPVRVIRA